jgi:hypothetical protein
VHHLESTGRACRTAFASTLSLTPPEPAGHSSPQWPSPRPLHALLRHSDGFAGVETFQRQCRSPSDSELPLASPRPHHRVAGCKRRFQDRWVVAHPLAMPFSAVEESRKVPGAQPSRFTASYSSSCNVRYSHMRYASNDKASMVSAAIHITVDVQVCQYVEYKQSQISACKPGRRGITGTTRRRTARVKVTQEPCGD